jgi:hypothetical protein
MGPGFAKLSLKDILGSIAILFFVLSGIAVFHAERVHYSGSPNGRERGIVHRDFRRVKQMIEASRGQGLEGERLYAAVEERLTEEYGPRPLMMLDGYRSLEQELAGVDLDALSPEARFDTVYKARRAAFGKELADTLFFQREKYARLRLQEEAILEDVGLGPEARQAEIAARRKALKAELASRGGYVSFGDERQDRLERELRERYGEAAVTAMSPEERRDAMREMVREVLSPEVLEVAERLLARRAHREASMEMGQSEGKAARID